MKSSSKKIVPNLHKKFNRIVMPLPKGGEDFLGTAFSAAKTGTIIHLYNFFEQTIDQQRPENTFSAINKACISAKLKYKLLGWVKCGQIAPRSYRVCVDFKIL